MVLWYHSQYICCYLGDDVWFGGGIPTDCCRSPMKSFFSLEMQNLVDEIVVKVQFWWHQLLHINIWIQLNCWQEDGRKCILHPYPAFFDCTLCDVCRRWLIEAWIWTQLVIGLKLDCECTTAKFQLVRTVLVTWNIRMVPSSHLLYVLRWWII